MGSKSPIKAQAIFPNASTAKGKPILTNGWTISDTSKSKKIDCICQISSFFSSSIGDYYRIGEKIGTGQFSTVYRGVYFILRIIFLMRK